MGFIDYLRETKAELRHVSWPTREQAIQYTTIVIGIAVGTGIFLGMLDYLFGAALHSLIARFG